MTMREKMARAMAATDGDPETVMASDYGRVGNLRWETFLPKVDAALDVLMEPADEVIDAGLDSASCIGEEGDTVRGSLHSEFQSVISAIKDDK